MNEQKSVSKRQEISEKTALALTQASSAAVSAYNTAQGGDNVVAALRVAEGIEDLRVLFDQPEIKQRIIGLQDQAIGFRTDRDPKNTNRKSGQPNVPYPWEVVRDAAIEATLRGLQLVGNQFNIISTRMYSTKEGYEFLIRKLKTVSDFIPIIGVPKNAQGGALVECSGTWTNGGKPQALTVTIPIKTDDYSGADQIIGKANRKFLKRCYEIMTGNAPDDGDAAELTGVMQIEDTPKTGFVPREKKAKVIEGNVTQFPTGEQKQAATAPEPDKPAEDPTKEIGPLQAEWQEICEIIGVSFDDFKSWLTTTGRYPANDSVDGWSEVPDSVAESLISDKAAHKNLRTLYGKAGK